VLALAVLTSNGCGSSVKAPEEPKQLSIDAAARQYVTLALSFARFDEDYVDAYQGPAEWREQAKADTRTLAQLLAEAKRLESSLAAMDQQNARLRYLRRTVTAMVTRMRMLSGEKLSFDEETRLIYDAAAPQYEVAKFDALLSQVDALLPGEGDLVTRVQAFQKSLEIPPDKLEPVYRAAVAECRRRTLEHVQLPKSESFGVEFVSNKPWPGYNWYLGDYKSVMQINTDASGSIDMAVLSGSHEGYPGHHVWGVLREQALIEEKGWEEFLVSPLFSPAAIITEGLAEYGVELAFSPEERLSFERDVLFPLAGLPPEKAETMARLSALRNQLAHGQIHVAREYLEGRMNKETATERLMVYMLFSRETAASLVELAEHYRGYTISYALGRDLVRDYIEARVGNDVNARWKAYVELITTPVTASDLLTAPVAQ